MSFDWNTVDSGQKSYKWASVTRTHPCPICEKPDWCRIREDGRAVVCMRSVSDRPTKGGGHIFDYDGSPVEANRLRETPPINAELAYQQMVRDSDPVRFGYACNDLGLDPKAVWTIGGVYSPFYKSLGWPTYRAGGLITGIRTRYKWGAKRSVLGSKAGVFAHRFGQYSSTKPLLIVEGPTDTAAAFQLGQQAIGRPGCHGYLDIVAEYQLLSSEFVIVADDDGPGREGADTLKRNLWSIMQIRSRIIIPPHGDMRAWLNSGATPEEVRDWVG